MSDEQHNMAFDRILASKTLLSVVSAQAGTPYYCYFADEIRHGYRRLTNALPNVSVLYSLKANPNLSIVRILVEEGAGLEVCSRFELETAILSGVDPALIFFVGPAKTAADLDRCIEVGVGAVIVESQAEIERLHSLARRRQFVQRIGIRINPSFKSRSTRLEMSGRPTQFGVDYSEVDVVIERLTHCPYLRLLGVHVYMGTRINDLNAILENTENTLKLADDIEALCGFPLEFIDIGGGFGVPYFADETPLNISALGEQMDRIISRYVRRSFPTRIVVELGRYLVAAAGVFVTSVQYVKQSKGHLFAICDGGSNCNSAAAGFGSLFQRNLPIYHLHSRLNTEENRLYTITGPLCTPTDVIARDIELNDLQVNDLIAIGMSGAYGLTASPTHFLGFGAPAEILVDRDASWLIRPREGFEEQLVRNTHVELLSADEVGNGASVNEAYDK